MADTKISALTSAGSLDGTETLPLLQGGANKKALLSVIATYINGLLGSTYQPIDSDLTAIAALSTTTYGRALLTAASGSDIKPIESLVVACSDVSTALTTGTAKVTFRMPYAFTLTDVRSSVNTAPTGSTLIVDVKESGTTIFSTLLSIDATEKTSTTAATPAVISDSSLADDAEMTIDITQIGSTVAGAGLKVTLIGHRT